MSAALLTGTGLEDLTALSTSVADGRWVAAGLHGTLTGIEGARMLADPFGTIAAWGIGWAIEHLKPIKGWYDGLAGEPDLIRGRAQEMYASATMLTALADDTNVTIRRSLSSLAGAAVTSGQVRGHEIASTLAAVSRASYAMGRGLEKAAVLVEGVRNLLRDLIADAVAWLIKRLVPGWSTVTLIPDFVNLVRTKVPRARKLFESLTESLSELSDLVNLMGGTLATLGRGIKEVAMLTGRAVIGAARSIDGLSVAKNFRNTALDTGIGMVSLAENDACRRPPEPRPTRVPHTASQAP